MNKIYIALIALFNPLWKRLGVNTEQLRAILEVKLKMDDRRPNAYTQMQQNKSKKEQRFGSWAIVLVSLLMGFFYLIVFSVGGGYLLQLFIWFTIFMVMTSITLISDFTNVLIDVRDNYVILPKPVNDKTVVVSRILHIMVHISKVVLPMSVPAFGFILITVGVAAAAWFALLVLLLSIFCVFLINAVYLLALKLTTPQRFKEILNYVQISFSILVFAIYYLAPKLLQKAQLEGVNLADYPWLSVVPTYWFAASWAAVAEGQFTGLAWGYIFLSVLVPFICLWLVVKVFAPSFNKKLGMLSGSGPEGPSKEMKKAEAIKPVSGKQPLYKRFSKLITRGTYEELSFELVWLITGRSREFKLKVYPSLAYVLVYFVYFLFGKGNGADAWRKLPQSNMFLFLIYSSSLAFITAISNLVYSDKFKAAWVYYAAPVQTPGQLLMGAFKAALVKFFLPFYLFIAVFCLYIWGWRVMPDLLLGLLNVILINLLFAFIYLRKLPFSAELNVKQGTGNFIKAMMILIIPGLMGVAHYFIAGYIWLVLLFGLLTMAALYILYPKYRETAWARVEI